MLVKVGKFTFPVDFVSLQKEEDGKVSLILGRPFLHSVDAVIHVKQKQLRLGVSAMKHCYSNDDSCFSIDEILEEDFDALLDEGSKILYSIEGSLLEDQIFTEFNEFIVMNIKENSESVKEEIPFEKLPLILTIRSRNLLMSLQLILNSNHFLITWNTHF
nr:reverse transcriptase domain-containing protein [Tanacetum cinerariifolium]